MRARKERVPRADAEPLLRAGHRILGRQVDRRYGAVVLRGTRRPARAAPCRRGLRGGGIYRAHGGHAVFLARLRRRHALFAGGILCAALLLVNSLFIWDFEVTGNETVPTETILHALREHGVHRGTFIYSFRSQDICNRVLPELKDLCWVAVNVRGCKAYVQVRERVRAPERVNESEPDERPRGKARALSPRSARWMGRKESCPARACSKGSF